MSWLAAERGGGRAEGGVGVAGVGWGCRWIRREVVGRFRVREGDGAGDLPFALDCLLGGVVAVADFGVACDHWDGELRLRAFGGAMQDRVKVKALQDVVVMDGRGSRVLERGKEYELGRGRVGDLGRGGGGSGAVSLLNIRRGGRASEREARCEADQ